MVILGIWRSLETSHYRLCTGGFESASYIKMMNAQADAAADIFAKTGRIWVIAQDNEPIYTSAG